MLLVKHTRALCDSDTVIHFCVDCSDRVPEMLDEMYDSANLVHREAMRRAISVVRPSTSVFTPGSPEALTAVRERIVSWLSWNQELMPARDSGHVALAAALE